MIRNTLKLLQNLLQVFRILSDSFKQGLTFYCLVSTKFVWPFSGHQALKG